MKPVIDQFLKLIPHMRELNIRYSAVGRDWAELILPYDERLVAYPAEDGGPGIIASGAVFTLMDSVAGFAVQAARRVPSGLATVDLRLDYLRPARPGEPITGYAKVHKLTRSIAFVRGYAHDGDRDDPIAMMAGCFMGTSGAKS
ncbi:PaaI family thioesterase [Pacificimonas sp. ICDLI1SI03]